MRSVVLYNDIILIIVDFYMKTVFQCKIFNNFNSASIIPIVMCCLTLLFIPIVETGNKAYISDIIEIPY